MKLEISKFNDTVMLDVILNEVKNLLWQPPRHFVTLPLTGEKNAVESFAPCEGSWTA